MTPQITPNSPAMLAQTASKKRHSRMASDRSFPGRAYPQIPAMATATRAAGETSRASTAALPTTSPPMMEIVCPMDWGRLMPASCSSSKAISNPRTSNTVAKGTAFLLSMIDCSSASGIISGWNVVIAT